MKLKNLKKKIKRAIELRLNSEIIVEATGVEIIKIDGRYQELLEDIVDQISGEIKKVCNSLLDELETETTHKYCDATAHNKSCFLEMGGDDQIRKTNLKIKKLRKLLK